jgi:lysophospholipase L1-like esterase
MVRTFRVLKRKGLVRGLLVVPPTALLLTFLTARWLPRFLPTTVPYFEASGFFPPQQTLLFLAWTSLATLLLIGLWRWAVGRTNRPVSEALMLAFLFLMVQEGAARAFLAHLPRAAYSPHPLLRWDLHGFERAASGKGHPAPPRVPGEFRVLCLGDSATYGVGVGVDDSWPARAQAELQQYSRRQLRFINHGVPGYTTWQAMAWLEWEGQALNPDLVLFASCHNDHSDSQEADPSWIGESAEQRRVRRLLMSPVLAQILRAMLLPPPRPPGIPALERPGFRVSLEQRRAALERVRELCRQDGRPLVLVLMPLGLKPWPVPDYITDFRRDAARNHLPLADAMLAAEESPDWRFLFPPDDTVHPTAQGQRVVADEVVRVLLEGGLVPME